MKKQLIVCLMALLPMLGWAQLTHSSGTAVDKQAAAILKRAAARFDKNVQFTVTATMLDSEHKPTAKQTARVQYNRGRYRLALSDQEVICDGTTVWQWNRSAKEVAVSNITTDDIDLLNPGRLLANYDKNFRSKYIRTEPDGTAVIDLQPRSARSFHKIRLLVAEQSGLLKRIEVHRYDSSRELYAVSDFKAATTPASSFTFDPARHPGVEIIDMR